MALTITLGNGGTSTATTLQAEFLNGGSYNEVAGKGTGGYFNEDSVAVGTIVVPNGGTGKGGVVEFGYTDDGAYSFNTSWNAVKDLKAVSNTNESIYLNDFVHADVDFSQAVGVGKSNAGSSITIENLKRGNIATGSGNDSIFVSLTSNSASWQNIVDVKSGAGDDTIKFDKGVVSGTAKVTDGSLTTVVVDAGAGTDSIDLSGLNLLASRVTGGAGNDTIHLSNGADTLVYGAANAGGDNVYGFNASQGDKLELADGVFVVSTGAVPNGSTDTYVTLSNQTTIIFHDSILAA